LGELLAREGRGVQNPAGIDIDLQPNAATLTARRRHQGHIVKKVRARHIAEAVAVDGLHDLPRRQLLRDHGRLIDVAAVKVRLEDMRPVERRAEKELSGGRLRRAQRQKRADRSCGGEARRTRTKTFHAALQITHKLRDAR
jgi:hypothetical protein